MLRIFTIYLDRPVSSFGQSFFYYRVTDAAFEISRQLKQDYPEADCIHLASAHWPTAHAIDRIESELGVSVMNSQQAIVWKALRTAGITEPIEGFGRLFREF